MRVRGADRISVTPLRPDLPSRAPFHRVIRPEDDRGPWRHQERQQQAQQDPTPLTGRPDGSVQDPVIVRKAALRRPAITRKAVVMVRAPGASIAPRSKTCAWHQTRGEKSGANGAKTGM